MLRLAPVAFTFIVGPAERLQEKFLRGILETVILTTLHPRTLITIIVQEIVNDGSLLAAAVNASMLAVLDAGLPVKSTAAAVQCSLTRLGGDFILDPSTQEEKVLYKMSQIVYLGYTLRKQ